MLPATAMRITAVTTTIGTTTMIPTMLMTATTILTMKALALLGEMWNDDGVHDDPHPHIRFLDPIAPLTYASQPTVH